MLQNCEIHAKFSTIGFNAQIVSADPSMGTIEPDVGVFTIESGSSVVPEFNVLTVAKKDQYTAQANDLYKFNLWTYTIGGGVEQTLPKEGIVVNSEVTFKAYFVNDDVKYKFYYDSEYSSLDINPQSGIADHNYGEKGFEIKELDFLSHSTFDFDEQTITIKNNQDASNKFVVTSRLNSGVVGYDFVG